MTPIQQLFNEQLDHVHALVDSLTVMIRQHEDNVAPAALRAWHEEAESVGAYQDFEFLVNAGACLPSHLDYHALGVELANIQVKFEDMTRDFKEKFVRVEDEPESLQTIDLNIITEHVARKSVEGYSHDVFDSVFLELANKLKADPYTFFAFTPIHLYFTSLSNKKLAKILQMDRKEIKAIRKTIGALIDSQAYSVRGADLKFAEVFAKKKGIDTSKSKRSADNPLLALFINNRLLTSNRVIMAPYNLYINYLAGGSEFQDLIYGRKYQIR